MDSDRETRIAQALEAIENGAKLTAAARDFQILRMTLQGRFDEAMCHDPILIQT